MTLTIPTWALWMLAAIIGIPALIAVLALAVFGYVAAKALAGAKWR